MQGYLFAHPMNKTDLTHWLELNTGKTRLIDRDLRPAKDAFARWRPQASTPGTTGVSPQAALTTYLQPRRTSPALSSAGLVYGVSSNRLRLASLQDKGRHLLVQVGGPPLGGCAPDPGRAWRRR